MSSQSLPHKIRRSPKIWSNLHLFLLYSLLFWWLEIHFHMIMKVIYFMKSIISHNDAHYISLWWTKRHQGSSIHVTRDHTRSTFVICIYTYIYMYMCLFCTLKFMLILTHQASKLENIYSEVETQSTKSEI